MREAKHTSIITGSTGTAWPAAMAGAAFLAMHALIHLGMIAGGHDHHAGSNLAAVGEIDHTLNLAIDGDKIVAILHRPQSGEASACAVPGLKDTKFPIASPAMFRA